MLASGYASLSAAHGTIGQGSEGGMVARVISTTGLSTGTTAAQREWLRHFDLPDRRYFREQQASAQALPHSVRVGTSSVVGGDYEFVESQAWPRDILHLTSNIFEVTRPYPVSQRYSAYRYDCACDRDHCVACPGARGNS